MVHLTGHISLILRTPKRWLAVWMSVRVYSPSHGGVWHHQIVLAIRKPLQGPFSMLNLFWKMPTRRAVFVNIVFTVQTKTVLQYLRRLLIIFTFSHWFYQSNINSHLIKLKVDISSSILTVCFDCWNVLCTVCLLLSCLMISTHSRGKLCVMPTPSQNEIPLPPPLSPVCLCLFHSFLPPLPLSYLRMSLPDKELYFCSFKQNFHIAVCYFIFTNNWISGFLSLLTFLPVVCSNILRLTTNLGFS